MLLTYSFADDFENLAGHMWSTNLRAGPLYRDASKIDGLRFRRGDGSLVSFEDPAKYTSAVPLSQYVPYAFAITDVSFYHEN